MLTGRGPDDVKGEKPVPALASRGPCAKFVYSKFVLNLEKIGAGWKRLGLDVTDWGWMGKDWGWMCDTTFVQGWDQIQGFMLVLFNFYVFFCYARRETHLLSFRAAIGEDR